MEDTLTRRAIRGLLRQMSIFWQEWEREGRAHLREESERASCQASRHEERIAQLETLLADYPGIRQLVSKHEAAWEILIGGK